MRGDTEGAGGWLDRAALKLHGAGVETPRRDATLLLAGALGEDKGGVLAHPERTLTSIELAKAEGMLGRRLRREPLQYILGFQEFWGLPVRVGPGCLIPRPETEHLVESALRLLRDTEAPALCEVGTGSGCVLLALATHRPDARLAGIEREAQALRWSALNLAACANVLLLRGDLEHAPPLRNLHAVLSNPPYITDQEWEELEPEVRDFEPPAALRCEDHALGPYRALARWASEALRPGGFLLCELGTAQARRASALRRIHPALAWREGVRDLAGHLRVAIWEKK